MDVLIVDDEPLAQDVLETYISRTPGLSLVGKCSNALEAFALLNRQPVDLMLLDINMPEMSGIEFLQALKRAPLTILTTAYSEFAITGFDLDVVDYLLKPFSFERFLRAINKANVALAKVESKGSLRSSVSDSGSGSQPDILFVRTDSRHVRIDLNELALVEGLKDYVRLWVGDAKLVIHSTMKGIEDSLSANPAFLRISKSYIVNLKLVSEIDGNCVVIKDQRLTIGATYRDAVMEVVGKYKL
jgi:DNA-binding LytR/AlgR family response regulator